MSDSQAQSALAYVDDLAAHLRSNPTLREELIELAMYASGGTRELILNAFMQLDNQQQLSLGNALLKSSFSNQRHDDVNLLATSTNMDKSVATQFSELLDGEPDIHIRESMVRAFNKQDTFINDQEILDIPYKVRTTDVDASVRGTALLTSARLSANPEDLMSTAIEAIRSDSSTSQDFGVQTLQEIIALKLQNESRVSWQDDFEAQQLAHDLMTPAFDNLPLDLRRSLDDLAARFF